MASFGTEAHIRIARQNSAGTPTTTATSFHSVPFINESIVVGNPDIISDTIRARYEEGPRQKGYVVPGGDILFRLHPDTLGIFLYAACGQGSPSLVGSVTTHIFQPVQTRFYDDLALTPWTLEKYPANNDSAHFYHDGNVSRFMLDITPGQFLRGGVSFMFRTHSLATKTTPAFPAGDEYTWNQVSLSIGGTGNVLWENMTLTLDNALQYVPALDGTKVMRRIVRQGFRTLRITGTADFPNNNEFTKFLTASEQSIDVTITGATLTTSQNNVLRIQVPTFRYETFPIAIPGPNRIVVGFAGAGIYNEGSGTMVKFTLINTRTLY